MAAEKEQNRGSIAGKFFAVGTFLCIILGCWLGPYVYKYIGQLCVYTIVADCWSLLVLLGIGALDIHLSITAVVQYLVKKINSTRSAVQKGIIVVFLVLFCACAVWVSFAEGVAISDGDKEIEKYEVGDKMGINGSAADIYVTITLDDGSTPKDYDKQYEIIAVTPKDLPVWKIVLDFPRYIVRQVRGIGSLTVVVKPIDNVIVQFSDPLISYGAETIMWICDPDLLGNFSTKNQKDYSAFFEYSYDGAKWIKQPICGTENTLPIQREPVFLRWNNDWKLSHRSLLNHQKADAKAGETVYFYYPGERVEFNLDMIRNSNSLDHALSASLKEATQYQLFLESIDTEAVHCNESIMNTAISASDLPNSSACIIKAGSDIVYHCYAGEKDLGFYCLMINHKAVNWEKTTLEQESQIVMWLNID